VWDGEAAEVTWGCQEMKRVGAAGFINNYCLSEQKQEDLDESPFAHVLDYRAYPGNILLVVIDRTPLFPRQLLS
jgi:hypothetical protein